MRLKPVDLGFGNRAILEANGREALEFLPVTPAVLAIQPVENANPVTARDRPDRSNVADQLEFGFPVRRLQDRTPAAQR